MSLFVNTNVSSLNSARQLTTSSNNLSTAFELGVFITRHSQQLYT